ncbi:MAG TPA: hypothetical protein VKH35_00340 [Thermoanaerobaculia bacterium]|nr:hypothetical protein [Thermoanaerobaculia bacterium]
MKRAIAAIGVLICAVAAFAQEHPEHPTNKTPPKGAHVYTMGELEKAITAEIQGTQQKHDGWYPMKDEKENKELAMKLDHVHTERLARLDPKTYFACTDFKSNDGHLVDVDFFMKDNGEKLVMTDATIHKVDGKPRYNWKEKNGFWERVPAE